MAPSPAPAPPEPKRRWRGRVLITVQTIIRYILAFGIMPYGISKLGNFQFQVSATDYSLPLGVASGKILTWAFLGYQPWFQFLLGALEAVPGVLLCFRRTWRMGALLLFPVLLNVVLMNFAMDLWPGTQRISCVLLFLNLCLIAFDAPRYFAFAKTLWGAPMRMARPWARIAVVVGELLIAAGVVGWWTGSMRSQVTKFMSPIHDFIGERQINSAGSYSIFDFSIGGQKISPPSDWYLYFDFSGRCVYVEGTQRLTGRFKADSLVQTFEISKIAFQGRQGTLTGKYSVLGNELWLDGAIGSEPVHMRMRRFNWGKRLPY